MTISKAVQVPSCLAATSLRVLCTASAVHVATFLPFGIRTSHCWGTDISTMPPDLRCTDLETSLIPMGYWGLVFFSSNMGLLFSSSSFFSAWRNGGLCPDIHLLQIQNIQSSFKKVCQTLSSFLFGLSPSPSMGSSFHKELVERGQQHILLEAGNVCAAECFTFLLDTCWDIKKHYRPNREVIQCKTFVSDC